jgi:hypothetical protein
MTSSLKKILDSKRGLRRDLASRPIAETLRMLDAMREREKAIGRDQVERSVPPSPCRTDRRV